MRKPDKDQFNLIMKEFAKAKQERFWLDVNLTDDQLQQIDKVFYRGLPAHAFPHTAYNMAIGFFERVMDVNRLPEKYQSVIKDYILSMDAECNAHYSIKGYSIETPNELYNFILKNHKEDTHDSSEV